MRVCVSVFVWVCVGARGCKPTWAYLFACFFVIEFVLVCGCEWVNVWVCVCTFAHLCSCWYLR